MEDRIDDFVRQAKAAREHADKMEGRQKEQWLRIAEMWELLAHEHRALQRRQDDKS